jgi:hypothetical protein
MRDRLQPNSDISLNVCIRANINKFEQFSNAVEQIFIAARSQIKLFKSHVKLLLSLGICHKFGLKLIPDIQGNFLQGLIFSP